MTDENKNTMFALDFSGGNTCKNDALIMEDMINALSDADTERRCLIKWQLFEKAGDNIPLQRDKFNFAYNHAQSKGFKTTASVFDEESLEFLLGYDVPFIKIANNISLYPLISMIPRGIPVVVSVDDEDTMYPAYIEYLFKSCAKLDCISKYPATAEEYISTFKSSLKYGISDHTCDWDLYKKIKPILYECHYKLPDSTGPDAGLFARTPEQIKEILLFDGAEEPPGLAIEEIEDDQFFNA